ncbi:MAG: DUF4064 domain-containing protein, partial [Mammaliicoccus vitulinus]
ILTLNVISFLLLIIAGIMLFVRKNKTNNQFEDVNFQNDLKHDQNQNENEFDSNEQQQNRIEETDKKKKDDDPYIY